MINKLSVFLFAATAASCFPAPVLAFVFSDLGILFISYYIAVQYDKIRKEKAADIPPFREFMRSENCRMWL